MHTCTFSPKLGSRRRSKLFLLWVTNFKSAYVGGSDGGSILLTLRYCNYDDVGLAPNVITYYEMLLVTSPKCGHKCSELVRCVGRRVSDLVRCVGHRFRI